MESLENVIKEQLDIMIDNIECQNVFKKYLKNYIDVLSQLSIEDWIFISNEYCKETDSSIYNFIYSSKEVKDDLNDTLIKGTLDDVFELIENVDVGKLNSNDCFYHIGDYGYIQFESEYEIITDFIDFIGLFQYIYDYFVDDESDEELDELLDNWDIDSILKYCRLW